MPGLHLDISVSLGLLDGDLVMLCCGTACSCFQYPSTQQCLCFPSPAWLRQQWLCEEHSQQQRWVVWGQLGPSVQLVESRGQVGFPLRDWVMATSSPVTISLLYFVATSTSWSTSAGEQLYKLGSPKPSTQPGVMEVVVDWTYPLCGHNQDNVAYVTPCLHSYSYVLWWARKKLSYALWGGIT